MLIEESLADECGERDAADVLEHLPHQVIAGFVTVGLNLSPAYFALFSGESLAPNPGHERLAPSRALKATYCAGLVKTKST